MILREPNRVAPLCLEKGTIVVNEDGQKFRVVLNSLKVIGYEPYAGKKQPTWFCYMGDLPSDPVGE